MNTPPDDPANPEQELEITTAQHIDYLLSGYESGLAKHNEIREILTGFCNSREAQAYERGRRDSDADLATLKQVVLSLTKILRAKGGKPDGE